MQVNKIIGPLMGLLFLVACKNPQVEKESSSMQKEQSLDTLHLALDWRPNVLHSGIFYAQSKAAFQEAGIHLLWDTPEIDNYTKKPIFRLLDGEVDLAIGPSEHLLSFAAREGEVKAQAVATILQSDRSAFVVKKSSGIESPAAIEGQTYLGYHTPLEDEILGAMISHASGAPNFETHTPGRLQVWEAFRRDSGEVAWVFLHWEAIQAEMAGDSLWSFIPNDFGVPYGYSSVIMAPSKMDSAQENLVRRFLKVCAEAYSEIQENPEQAIASIRAEVDHSNFQDSIFINRAFADILPHFGKGEAWGKMKPEKWRNYGLWLQEKDLLSDSLLSIESYYRNDLLMR